MHGHVARNTHGVGKPGNKARESLLPKVFDVSLVHTTLYILYTIP